MHRPEETNPDDAATYNKPPPVAGRGFLDRFEGARSSTEAPELTPLVGFRPGEIMLAAARCSCSSRGCTIALEKSMSPRDSVAALGVTSRSGQPKPGHDGFSAHRPPPTFSADQSRPFPCGLFQTMN